MKKSAKPSSVPPPAGSSRSRRMSCCPRLCTRVFVIVGRPLLSTKRQSMPPRASSPRSSSASGSHPTTPSRVVRAPSVARFTATFAAPPGRSSLVCTWTTGTGASGEMRLGPPNRERSSITAPATSTRATEKSGIASVTAAYYPYARDRESGGSDTRSQVRDEQREDRQRAKQADDEPVAPEQPSPQAELVADDAGGQTPRDEDAGQERADRQQQVGRGVIEQLEDAGVGECRHRGQRPHPGPGIERQHRREPGQPHGAADDGCGGTPRPSQPLAQHRRRRLDAGDRRAQRGEGEQHEESGPGPLPARHGRKD